MPEILHDFPIEAPIERVFETLCSPAGLDAWWTLESQGTPGVGQVYRMNFGPEYDWRAVMRECRSPARVEWEFTDADLDWRGTRVGFELVAEGAKTLVKFTHTGWRERNAHFRTSSFCWAMYLRLLCRYVEHGEVVPYAQRLSA